MHNETSLWTTGLLFDLEGTLIDAGETQERHWRAFAERHGLDGARITLGAQGRRSDETIDEWVPGEYREEELAWFGELEVGDVVGVTARAGARKLLEALEGIRWGVVTAGDHDLARARLVAAGLPTPKVIVEDVGDTPDKSEYRKGLELLGVPASDALVFESSRAGVVAGSSAGIDVVEVGEQELGATYRVKELGDVRVIATRYGGAVLGLVRAHDGAQDTIVVMSDGS